MYASVIISYNSKSIDKTFTYIVPKKFINVIKPGVKVKVNFNAKNIYGFVTSIFDEYNEEYELKEIVDVINPEICFNEELLQISYHLKQLTFCSMISAIQTMLPTSFKIKETKENYDFFDKYIELNKDKDYVTKYILDNKRSKRQIEILELLLEFKKLKKKDLQGTSLKTLLDNGIVKEIKEVKYRINKKATKDFLPLTDDQQKVVNSIDLDTYKTHLIHGVTGSGKTEVYLHLIKDVISKNKTALMLVPEISLTAQIVNRFYERFGNKVAIFHSKLSDGEKYDEYLKIIRNEVNVVVGTRSSIFVPINNLGIIIIDEEHSENYKQDTVPRYNAIDIAKFRAEYNNIPVILGSATPSLESMARAKKGLYNLLTLDKRVGNATLPDVTIIDMQEEMKKRNMIFSDMLLDKIKNRLEKKEQIILLLNRRGFSTTIHCSNCGYTHKCPNCDITLTYHKTSNNLRCHYCGYTLYKIDECPECHEKSLNYYGLGTEKLESELQELFPSSKIVRMDADTTSKKNSVDEIVDKFDKQEYDILLGTQMISKGFDFPNVTLVGIINADSSLNIPDFRSAERTYQMLSQTSGRAGRKDKKGEVIIQTFNPTNYTLDCVKRNSYEDFYEYEMLIRKKLSYPPYYYISTIKIASSDYNEASKEITKVLKYLKNRLEKTTIILGPTPAALFKHNNIYRFQIIIKYKKDNCLSDTLKELDEIYALNKNINIEIDNNPSYC